MQIIKLCFFKLFQQVTSGFIAPLIAPGYNEERRSAVEIVKPTTPHHVKPSAQAANAGLRFVIQREIAIAPKTKKAAKPKTKKTAAQNTLYDFILKALDQEKVEDVVSIDLKGKTIIADYMIVATGSSSRQVAATASKLRDKLAAEGMKARVEGQTNGDWVIVDAGDVVVHLFRAEVRKFYNLEKLWGTDFSTVGYNLYTST
jgi:ribosome-associated protein